MDIILKNKTKFFLLCEMEVVLQNSPYSFNDPCAYVTLYVAYAVISLSGLMIA